MRITTGVFDAVNAVRPFIFVCILAVFFLVFSRSTEELADLYKTRNLSPFIFCVSKVFNLCMILQLVLSLTVENAVDLQTLDRIVQN